MQSRPIYIDEATLNPRQKEVYQTIVSGPRGAVEGPLRVWLLRPDLASVAQALGAYCRYNTSLSVSLSELAIIIVGAHWRAGFEWHTHAPTAIQAGVPAKAVDAIRRQVAPTFEDEQMELVYKVTIELLQDKVVSDATYDRAQKLFGTETLVDLIAVIGYYTLICMTINAFKVPVPAGEPEPFAV